MRLFLRRTTAAALLYAAALVLFQGVFRLPDTNIRLGAFLAPLAGIAWGPPGIVGAGMGNFLADMAMPYFAWDAGAAEYVFGSLGNLLIAALSYRMWHGLFLRAGDDPFLVNLRNIVRYIAIQFFVAVASSIYFALVHALTPERPSPWTLFGTVLFNNFDVNVLLGLPVLILLMSRHYAFYRPQGREGVERGARRFDAGLLGTCLLGLALMCLPLALYGEATFWLRLFALLFFLYLFRPLPPSYVDALQLPQPIYSRIAVSMCAFMACLVPVLSFHAFLSMRGDYASTEIWLAFYREVFLVLHFTLAVLLLLLWYMERHIVRPIAYVTGTATAFACSDPEDPAQRVSCRAIPSGDELELLSGSLGQMLDSTYDYIARLKESLAEREREWAQMEIAMNIQASLLPSPQDINVRFPGLRLGALMQPALGVGGDFYDFLALDDDHIALVAADVSGKGMPAALFMTISHTLLHHKLKAGEADRTLAQLMAETNGQLCENNPTGMFTTAIAAVYEVSTRRLRYVNAGHTSPLIVHADGSGTYLEERSGIMLGSMEDMPYGELEAELAPGDLLLLYSDGVTEAMNEREEFFEDGRLMAAMAEWRSRPGEAEAAAFLRERLADFAGTAPQSDDITIVTLAVS